MNGQYKITKLDLCAICFVPPTCLMMWISALLINNNQRLRSEIWRRQEILYCVISKKRPNPPSLSNRASRVVFRVSRVSLFLYLSPSLPHQPLTFHIKLQPSSLLHILLEHTHTHTMSIVAMPIDITPSKKVSRSLPLQSIRWIPGTNTLFHN